MSGDKTAATRGQGDPGFWWGSAQLQADMEDPEFGELSYIANLANYNAVETARARLEGRKPKLRKRKLVKRTADWARERHSQVQAEIARRKWLKVVNRLKPLVQEAEAYVQQLQRELSGQMRARKFGDRVAERRDREIALQAAKTEAERLGHQYGMHVQYLAEAERKSGWKVRHDMKLEATEKLRESDRLQAAAHDLLSRITDFSQEAEEALIALVKGGDVKEDEIDDLPPEVASDLDMTTVGEP